MLDMIEKIGLVAAICLPLWNIPLIMNIIKRKSSADISLHWLFGVWTCLNFMSHSGFTSPDIVWKAFNIANIFLFTAVVVTVMIYRKKKGDHHA